MKWLKDALDSYGWLELCFFADEEMILDELQRLEPEMDWSALLDRFTSAEFVTDTAVTFTVSSKFPGRSRYAEECMREAFWNLYQERVSITILREATE